MVSLLDVVNLLRTEFPDMEIYPLEIPLNAPVDSVSVDLYSTNGVTETVYQMMVQFKVRCDHPADGERMCFDIRKFLHGKTDFQLGDVQVVLSQAQNPVPLYMGRDTDGYYKYSNNFRFTVNEGVK